MQETERLVHSKYLVFILLHFINPNLQSQVYPVSKVDSLLKQGITHIVNQDYDKAELYFDTLNKNFPELPLGNIYLAANKIAKAFDQSEAWVRTTLCRVRTALRQCIEQKMESAGGTA